MKLFSLKLDYMAVLLYSLYRVREDANDASIAVSVASSLKVHQSQHTFHLTRDKMIVEWTFKGEPE